MNGFVAVKLIIQHSLFIASVFVAPLNPHQLFLSVFFRAEQQCLTQFPPRVGRVMAADAALAKKRNNCALAQLF